MRRDEGRRGMGWDGAAITGGEGRREERRDERKRSCTIKGRKG